MTTIFDTLKAFPDQLMQYVQTASLVLSSSFDRSVAPYYVFGDITYEGTPNTCPSVRWRTSEGTFDFVSTRGGFGVQGSCGTSMQRFDARIVGRSEAEAWQELVLIVQRLQLFQCNPPISEVSWQGTSLGAREKNSKFGYELTLVAPVEIPPDLTGITSVTITEASSSLAFSGSNGSIEVVEPPG